MNDFDAEFVILKNGDKLYYEAYEFLKASRYMSAEQRKRALNMFIALFPDAFEFLVETQKDCEEKR